jgi:hypothetical protein
MREKENANKTERKKYTIHDLMIIIKHFLFFSYYYAIRSLIIRQ